MCFSSPKPPAPPPLPPPPPPIPTPLNPEVKAARSSTRRRAALAGGRGSTIVTSSQGLSSASEGTKKTLLGT